MKYPSNKKYDALDSLNIANDSPYKIDKSAIKQSTLANGKIQTIVAFLCFVAFVTVQLIRSHWSDKIVASKNLELQTTIRVNTFRRLDLLKIFLDSYVQCGCVAMIQVVWSDTVNKPPQSMINEFINRNVVFEIHKNNSLSNRFKPLINIPTQSVLSIDDDLVIPCDHLLDALVVWNANRRVLVGFSPRIAAKDPVAGKSKYFNWQYTWWNGRYSIMLTKASFLHRDYLGMFHQFIPEDFLHHIDKHRNCEDIAMAHLVAEKAKAGPVWVQSTVYETSASGISSGNSHFVDRSQCLDQLQRLTRTWPWIDSYQKM
eukprot:gene4192-5963_t